MSQGDKTEDSPPESALQDFFAIPLINVKAGGRHRRPDGRHHHPDGRHHHPDGRQRRPRALFRSLAPL